MSENSNYQQAGVNIEAGNEFVDRLKPLAKKTHRPEVLDSIGGFASLCSIPSQYKEPILVSATDGVGTKLKIATALKQYDTLGIDLVAMCVNDVLATGAEPLFFLDYYACGQLNIQIAEQIIIGIAEGCIQAGCSLIGGETAEMPGVYPGEDYDLAGFCVGVVEKSKRIDIRRVRPGDALIALSSSGIHSNGYSLVRHILANTETPLSQPFDSSTLGETLLTPTKIYAKTISALLEKHDVHALAHITGGGLLENVPRVLPPNTQALINSDSWEWPAIFQWLQNNGNLADQEMWQTFNCGVGFIICLPEKDCESALITLASLGETAWKCGEILAQEKDTPTVQIQS